jgi:hypothetical protein
MKTQTVHDPPPKKTPPGWLGREDAKMLNIGSDERSILTLHLQQSNSAATPPLRTWNGTIEGRAACNG